VSRWLQRLLVVATFGIMAHHPDVGAHEARPAYLELTETHTDRYDVVWRTPVLAGMRLPVVLQLPNASEVVEPKVRVLPDSVVERWIVTAPGGFGGKRIEFVGLQATITDVLVRIQTLDGALSTSLVRPSQPWMEIASDPGSYAIAVAYLMHGVDHILFGYDHLLFVLALILLVPNRRALIATVTAFTLAHSLTLALSTLGIFRVPGPPVEATIALSILLLACEIVRSRTGRFGLTSRWPWLVAFSFGLLHGFGFASALAQVGLPQKAIPIALLLFNVGVEVGQLLFVGTVLTLTTLVRRQISPTLPRLAQYAMPYAIGTIAMFWVIERLGAFWH